MTFHDLLIKLELYLQPPDIAMIQKAYVISEKAHEGQFRESQIPYIQHPLEVASILADLKLDAPTLAAGLLHDCIEDTHITPEYLKKEFGEEVAQLVEGVTKIDRFSFSSHEEAQAENYRKMLIAIAKDIRVVMIKLADRLHNMRTLKHKTLEKQKQIAQETLDIYAPLAHRFGMANLKWELEDLSFFYLDYQAFQDIKTLVASKRKDRETYLLNFQKQIESTLHQAHIQAELMGRPKHFYSIYKKLSESNISFDALYDMLGIRILVENIKTCYEVLGLIHSLYTPVSGRFKDYIAMPKPNLYQSLHTTVLGPQAQMIEIQIRTKDMHEIAEKGVAAHWRYKEGKTESKYTQKFSWINNLINDNDSEVPKEFISQLKADLFSDEVFAFTPNGDIKVLPKGATPLDFAYLIHTQIGHCYTGAKINGHIVTLNYVLQNEDKVDILTSKTPHPKLDWLNFVFTHQAKTKIKQWFKKQNRHEKLAQGKEKLEKALQTSGLSLTTIEKWDEKTLLHHYKVKTLNDLYLGLAEGDISIRDLLPKETEAMINPSSFKNPIQSETGILVMGDSQIQNTLAKCCWPIPGDPIIGIVTIEKGVCVHRQSCPNLVSLPKNKANRLIDVSWTHTKSLFSTEIQIEAFDRIGILQEILRRISDNKVNVTAVKTKSIPNQSKMWAKITIQIPDHAAIQQLKQNLSAISDIISIYRI